ncbi:MAG: Nramp family divalent metal transporter [Actinobacteria bacterium]|nr:Nramp family divalent metal transporter [Actinomycetota bacterium]
MTEVEGAPVTSEWAPTIDGTRWLGLDAPDREGVAPIDSDEVGDAQDDEHPGWRGYLKSLGPGLVTGASDDDPSGIATYSQAGAQYQYGLLWAALLTFPLSATVQEICDRTALTTGKNLGELARTRFGRWGTRVVGLLLITLLVANTLNITADVLAVGAGMNLLGAGPIELWAGVAGLAVTVLIITGSFETIARVFKFLCLALLVYIVVLFFAGVSWRDVALYTFVPHIELSAEYFALLVAVLGTTISPYLFFWQSAHRVEELEADGRNGDEATTLSDRTTKKAQRKERRSRFDVFFGIGFSNLVMFAIIVATGATIGAQGAADVNSAADAASALKPAAGNAASMLFALGFIGSGMLAIPVLAGSASTGIAGLLGQDWGFSERVRQAPLFYALVGLGTVGGTALSLLGVDPMSLLVVVAVINGIAAAPFLVVVMLIASDRSIMGEHRNRRVATILGWGTASLMGLCAVALLITTVTD